MNETDEGSAAPVSGIYQIRNRHTGCVYIGKSKNIHMRWLAHRFALDRGLHFNDKLQGDWEIYGPGAFDFTIVEEVSGDRALGEAEARYWSMASNTYNVAPVRTPKGGSAINTTQVEPVTGPEFVKLLFDGMPSSGIGHALYALTGIEEIAADASLGSVLAAALTADPDVLRDLATYYDHGYRGLYGGESARDIAARKGLAKGQQILDWMGSDELAANLFRASQTEQKLRREPIQGKPQANQTHHDVGRAVRTFIIEQGNLPPEQLPTPEVSVQELQRREQQRIEAERQPSLFPADEGNNEP